jgi:hypothetical protein
LYNSTLTQFEQQYAHDLILECFGTEAELLAEDWHVTEQFYNDYVNRILDQLDIIQGKHVVDVGSSTGVYSILMKMHGAKSVTSIEPRKQYSDALQRVSDKHNLDINCICGFHTAVHNLYNVETVVLGAVLDLIPDHVGYLRDLDCKHIHLWTGVNEDVFDDCLRAELHHNLYHRGGFAIQEDLLNDVGMQTDIHSAITNPNRGRYLKYRFGEKYFATISQYLNYEIMRKTQSNGVQYWTLKCK